MKYDVIFLKGGNQYNYYTTYNDTKTEQAITDIYNDGGVICGTSAGLAVLGDVDFTAESGTVYPYECLENWDNQYVQLADDFLPLLSGVIFDSHFVQRGRFPRLLGFMANWYNNTVELVTGIGVDDKTALGIDANLQATAFGSGCVNIYYANDGNVLSQNTQSLSVDSIAVTQLIAGTSMNLSNFEVIGFDNEIEPSNAQETGNYTIYASGGSNRVDQNESLLRDFALNNGKAEDTVLILSGNDQDTAGLYEDYLNSLGVQNTEVFPATPVYSDNVALTNAIKNARKFLFVKAEWTHFQSFLNGANGKLLLEKLDDNQMISAFIGDNSRYPGKTVVNNYDSPSASYDGLYELEEGLGLLNTTVLIPKTYDPAFDASYSQYENTIAAIPYAMVKDTLSFGVWLTRNNYIKYQPQNGESILHAYGKWPVMILTNNGTSGETVSRGVAAENTEVRMLGGFKKMQLSVIDSTMAYKMGNTVEEEEDPVSISGMNNKESAEIFAQPNLNKLHLDWNKASYSCTIYNTQGMMLIKKQMLHNQATISYPDFPEGIYIICLEDDLGNIVTRKLFLE